MKNGANSFTPERIAKLRKNIDFSDIPEINDFSQGHLRNWKPVKKPMTMKVDADVLEALRKSGKGWQTRVNNLLRQAVANDLI